jgi:hypothetical protein
MKLYRMGARSKIFVVCIQLIFEFLSLWDLLSDFTLHQGVADTHICAYLALVSTQPSPLMKLYVRGRSGLILRDISGSLGLPENAIFPMVCCSW